MGHKSFNHCLRSEIGLADRLLVFRKVIKPLKVELRSGGKEIDSLDEFVHGYRWAADAQMQRVPETDCRAILVVTPRRILIAPGELTEQILYEEIARCYWERGDLCLKFQQPQSGAMGLRIEPSSRPKIWSDMRRRLLADKVTWLAEDAGRRTPR